MAFLSYRYSGNTMCNLFLVHTVSRIAVAAIAVTLFGVVFWHFFVKFEFLAIRCCRFLQVSYGAGWPGYPHIDCKITFAIKAN